MKCPICKSEMEAGALTIHGGLWERASNSFKIKLPLPSWLNFLKGKYVAVSAFYCNNCGKIELQRKV